LPTGGIPVNARPGSLNEALSLLRDESRWTGRAPEPGAWAIPQAIEHCAQSIEYSIRGYPRNKPWLFRALIGPIVKRRFLARGRMGHALDAAIPGAPALTPGISHA